ncbi:MAG TPA: alginate lyase family protein [Tepidisphaeraceae bacterium]|nr:alginate lyase family protein [Tepidisphaeraceae bacterium]
MPRSHRSDRHLRAAIDRFALQALEPRTFLSASPIQTSGAAALAQPAPAGEYYQLAAVPTVTKAMRQELVNKWSGANKADLQAKLDENKMGAFDTALLSYMTGRSGQTFYWKTGDVAGIKSFVNSWIATSTVVSNANHIVAHEFPDGNSAQYDVHIDGEDINWKHTTTNPEFVHTLNRHDFWQDLAQAYVFTGDSKYVDELVSQLASWSAQSPALADPNQFATMDPPWQPLDTAFRADNWTWAYQMVLGSAGWTGTANTLFLYKLQQHGDFLRRVTPYALDSNRSLFEASGLLQIAHLVPEFSDSADWKTYARNLLFGAMDKQINADGGHAESSPGYAGSVINSLLEMYWLDQKKGESSAWDAARKTRLENAAQSYVQLLAPNGTLSPLSDTYRQTSDTFWLRPRIILGNTSDFPAAKPRLRDVWLFGAATADANKNAPISPAMPNRGNTFNMPQSGYYVMRSGSDSNARQIIFDAGPTGGQHGHYDLLNFELFGYGAPLISDPGLYTYDTSARRNWAVSTQAHNTINVGGASHAALEGVSNPGITRSNIASVAGGYMVTASHRGYQGATGAPVLARSIWYDGAGTMIVVDWAESTSAQTFSTSFLLPGTGNTSSNLGDGWIKTNNAGGNVKIEALNFAGQTAGRDAYIPGTTTPVFTSSDPDANIAKAAQKWHYDQSGTFAGFVTLINAYTGGSVPNVTASVVGSVTKGGTFQVQITRGGSAAETVSFSQPPLDRPPADFRGSGANGAANDMAWDAAGRLHMVFNDRGAKNLKYSVRDTNGVWSAVQTIDAGFEAGGYPSLAIDSKGNPAVAYFDGNGGDLKFAKMNAGAWQVETVDSAGSVGLYPSLVFSRKDGAMIAYYHRTKADLRLAVQVAGGWQIATVDSAGDVGRCTAMTLDPNRPTASKVAIAYEDSTHGNNKFAIQSGAGWAIQTVDSSLTSGGGYTSLVYEPYQSADGTYHPTMSYYDSGNTAVKFARQEGASWASQVVFATGQVGLYTQLYYDSGNRPNVFYFRKNSTTYYRAKLQSGAWKQTYVTTGGREDQIAVLPSGQIAYSNVDTDGLRVGFLAS